MAITKYYTNKGVRYKATLWSENKAIASKSFARKFDAEEWHKRESFKIINSKVGRIAGLDITLKDFFISLYLPNSRVRESTIVDYKRIFLKFIEPVFGHEKLAAIDSNRWNEFLNDLIKSGISNARRNRIHAVASAIYKTAFKMGYLPSNPLLRVDCGLAPKKWTRDHAAVNCLASYSVGV